MKALLKIDLPWMTVFMPQKTDVAVSVALPQIKQTQQTNKQTIKQTKKQKNLKPHKCIKTKKGASSLALLKIDLPWMTVCMPQKTDVAVSVALPMNFAFFYDATIMTF